MKRTAPGIGDWNGVSAIFFFAFTFYLFLFTFLARLRRPFGTDRFCCSAPLVTFH